MDLWSIFYRILVGMLAKTPKRTGRDWDQHLPFVVFAYRVSKQESTQESPRLTSLKQYGSELADQMSSTWELARKSIIKAQCKQKAYCDQSSKPLNFKVSGQVFLFMPAERPGENWKLARPHHGPYCVVKPMSLRWIGQRVSQSWLQFDDVSQKCKTTSGPRQGCYQEV